MDPSPPPPATGDTELVRRRVQQLRDQGSDVQLMADQLVARVDALGWTGRAADSMRDRVGERARHLRRAADHHVAAADALADHVGAVDRVRDEIAAIELRTHALRDDARARVRAIEEANAERAAAGGVVVEPDRADTALLALDPPPPGHPAWLALEIPGREH